MYETQCRPARKAIIVNGGYVARSSGQREMRGSRIAKRLGKLTRVSPIIVVRAADNGNFSTAIGKFLRNGGNI